MLTPVCPHFHAHVPTLHTPVPTLQTHRWFGIDWDEGPDVGGSHWPYSQSERSHLYRTAFEKLREGGFVFPCTCSRRVSAGGGGRGDVEGVELVFPATAKFGLGAEEGGWGAFEKLPAGGFIFPHTCS